MLLCSKYIIRKYHSYGNMLIRFKSPTKSTTSPPLPARMNRTEPTDRPVTKRESERERICDSTHSPNHPPNHPPNLTKPVKHCIIIPQAKQGRKRKKIQLERKKKPKRDEGGTKLHLLSYDTPCTRKEKEKKIQDGGCCFVVPKYINLKQKRKRNG